MTLTPNSISQNWSGSHPSKLDASTSFNVVGMLTVPSHKEYGCTANDANRAQRRPVHREGKKMAFKIKFQASTEAGHNVEAVLPLKADSKDQIRQEYVCLNKPVPDRDDGKWAGENTYDFGHYKTMMDDGLDGYFGSWINAMNSMYRVGKNPLRKGDFTLNSGYRNPHHNVHHAHSGGLSSHMYGYALDVNGRDIDDIRGADQAKMVLAAYAAKPEAARFSQKYEDKTHVHADWAPDAPVKWKNRKKTADDPPNFQLPAQSNDQPIGLTPAPSPTPTPMYHACGVHQSWQSGDHSHGTPACGDDTHAGYACQIGSAHINLMASCSETDSHGQGCTVTNFYECQSHTHQYPALISGACGHSYTSAAAYNHRSETCPTNSSGQSCTSGSYYACSPHTHAYPVSTVSLPVWSDIPDPYNLTVGDSFSLDLSSYVTGSPTFTRNGGRIPAGLSFSDGVLSGTVLSVESRGIRFTATNTAGSADSEWIKITVTE